MAAALAHAPMWGWVASLSYVVSSGMITVFYLWRRDLNATILAHVLIDLVGVLIVPMGNVVMPGDIK